MAVEAVAGLSKFLFLYKAYLVGFLKAGQKFPKPFTLALPILLRVNLVYENFLSWNLSFTCFTTKLARISCPIPFQAISKIIGLDLFLKTSIEGMFPSMYVDVW